MNTRKSKPRGLHSPNVIRTRMATRKSAEGDYMLLIGSTFIIGAMLGAVITLAAFTSGLIIL